MSSGGSGSSSERKKVEVILEVQEQESTEDPPMEEWSSLLILNEPENPKRLAYEEGLYDPGSGEICTKYIAMSASEVFRHPYYNFPAVTDPGIMEALLQPEPQIVYPPDGQDLYLALCNEMNTVPVKIFYRGLLTDNINLKYYSVRPNGVRAMAKALENNEYVEKFNLTDNFLNDDACFHLGDMLLSNKTLYELNLSGCRIGPPGLRMLLKNMANNKTLKVLNLNKNQLGDDGVEILANSLLFGCKLNEIYLSYNNITAKGAEALADALETFNDFRIIDLSWNTMQGPRVNIFLNRLSENTLLQELNLSWNGLTEQRTAELITKCMAKCISLRKLDLSYNNFSGRAISSFSRGLVRSQNMWSLNLSANPLAPKDALTILEVLNFENVTLNNLIMDHVIVNEEFVTLLNVIKSLDFRKDMIVTHGDVRIAFASKGPDRRELILNRMDALCKEAKFGPVDFGLICLQLAKNKVPNVDFKQLYRVFKPIGVVVDEAVIDTLMTVFPGPRTEKDKSLSIPLVVDYIKRKWPDRHLPPTPPPPPEPEKKKKGKGKKKK